MRRTNIPMIVVTLLLVLVAACGRPAATTPPTPDTQATVDAAIAATSAAQVQAQQTIAAAVQATNAAIPTPDTQSTVDAAVQATSVAHAEAQATLNAAVQATVAAMPTPTPVAEYVTLTEEELAALIDEAVAEANAAAEQCSTATTEATSDDTITYEEVLALAVYADDVEQIIAYAEELLDVYYDLYGALATETLDTLVAIEQELVALSDDIAALYALLEEINTTLVQGLELAEETIAQLEAAADMAQGKTVEIQAQAEEWLQELQGELESRAAAALTVQPNLVAEDRLGALQVAFDYVDAVRQSLVDRSISPEEMADIAQLGANAAASLEARGGAALQRLSGSINDITGQLARGQVPQAQAGLGSLESALGSRPSRP